MAHLITESELSTPETRSRLQAGRTWHWHEFQRGCYLGYYKGDEVRSWSAGLGKGRKRRASRLALADDIEPADGSSVLNFEQARAAARNWCAEQVIAAAHGPIDDRPFMTAGPACGSYLTPP